MKRFSLAIVAFMSLTAVFAALQERLPASVQRFLELRSDQAQMMKSGSAPTLTMTDSEFAPTINVDGVEMVEAFIDIDSDAAIGVLRAQGVKVNCEFDDFVTALIPVDRLALVSRLPGVVDVEVSRMVQLCTDTTLRVTHAGEVINGLEHGLPQGYDGSGVVIGIIDNGFDYQHEAFKSAEDSTRSRIVRVYDPENTTGHPALIGGNALPGSVFMGEQIDTLTTDSSPNTHGTHTASIAAGKHVGGYGGMAPNADIVMCVCRYLNLNIPEVEVANCIKYIYSYADSVGKPCVISVSVSTSHGQHDGNDRISKAIAQTTGPGRIFVIAAGNTGSGFRYSTGKARSKKPFNMLLGCYQSDADDYYYLNSVFFDSWVREKYVRPYVKFHIFDNLTKRIVWESELIPTTRKIESTEISEYYEPDSSVSNSGYLRVLVSTGSSGKYQIQCFAQNLKCRSYTVNSSGKRISRYMTAISIYPPSIKNPQMADSLTVDSWVVNGSRGRYHDAVYVDEVSEDGDTTTTVYDGIDAFYAWPRDDCSIGSYTVNDSTISAGAYVGRNNWYSYYNGYVMYDNSTVGNYYNITSYEVAGAGPTGKPLPTVTAPGVNVVAAASRYSSYNTTWHPQLVMRHDGNAWCAMSGTSMAAPTVAGIIAQWLQINPNLGPSDVKNIIAQTAIKDSFTMDPTNGARFGPNGKIDAMAGARLLLGIGEDDSLPGDLDEDGKINLTDLIELINCLLNTVGEIDVKNGDYNQDGTIDVTDAIDMIDHLLNTI